MTGLFTLPELTAAFEVKNRQEVKDILHAHPFLADVINETAPRLPEKFGADAGLSVEVFNEGANPHHAQLFLTVWTGPPALPAGKRLEELYWGWRHDVRRRAQFKMNLGLAFSKATGDASI